MGDKAEARATMIRAGLPVLPGSDGPVGDLETAQRKLDQTLGSMGQGRGTGVAQLPLRPFRGDLPWPAPGRAVTRFGRQQHPPFRTPVAKNGIDIGAPSGSAAAAVHEGTVAYADFFMGFGNLLIIDHGAQAYSLYGNLASMAVRQGARVTRGQTIGTVGSGLNGTPSLY